MVIEAGHGNGDHAETDGGGDDHQIHVVAVIHLGQGADAAGRDRTEQRDAGATSNTGTPKCNGVGKANTGSSLTLEKSAMPNARATSVPITIASRIDRREMVALPTLLNRRTAGRWSAAG